MIRRAIRSAGPTGGEWRWSATTQATHDGTVLPTWGVRVAETGQWVGKAHAIGSSPAKQAEAHANDGLFAASKTMSELLVEAMQAWTGQFDDDSAISGADLLQWFVEWRLRARLALDAAGVP